MKTKFPPQFVLAFCIMSMMLAVSCDSMTGKPAGQPFSYKIVGKTNYLPENCKIILYRGVLYKDKPTDDQKITVMTVKNNAFSFEGRADKTECAVLYIPSETAYMPVFIEKGTVQVHFDKDPIKTRVSGTPFNDSLQMLAKNNIEMANRVQKELQDIHNPPTEAELQKMQSLNKVFRERIRDVHYHCALRNINNELGLFLTINSSDLFSKRQLQTLLQKLPAQQHGHPVIKQLETPVDKVIPDFSLQDERGVSYNVKNIVKQYKVTVIDFWASWCKPCMNEMPSMIALRNVYRNKGLGVIGISLDEDKSSWVSAFTKYHADWLQLWDEDGSIAEMFKIESIPHTIIVNNKGEVLATKLRGEELQQYIDKILK